MINFLSILIFAIPRNFVQAIFFFKFLSYATSSFHQEEVCKNRFFPIKITIRPKEIEFC
jgi:hypothetical protein